MSRERHAGVHARTPRTRAGMPVVTEARAHAAASVRGLLRLVTAVETNTLSGSFLRREGTTRAINPLDLRAASRRVTRPLTAARSPLWRRRAHTHTDVRAVGVHVAAAELPASPALAACVMSGAPVRLRQTLCGVGRDRFHSEPRCRGGVHSGAGRLNDQVQSSKSR